MSQTPTKANLRALLCLGLATPWILIASACQEPVPEVTPEEGTLVAQLAEPAAGELLRTLVGQLTTAVEAGGPASAVEFCSIEAIPLTRLLESGLDGGLKLKRTSFRVRNWDNAPDEAEEMALRYFEEAIIDHGEAPSYYVQKVSDEEFRYYKPLFVAEFCLQCHGEPEGMEPEVLRRLQTAYPEDLATGYSVGDFRGAVRVSVPSALITDLE